MKKGVAVGLLVVGSVAVIGGISLANLCLFFGLYGGGLVLAILVTSGAVFGITRLRGAFERRYGISAPKFALLAFVPSVAVSGIFYIVILILDKAGYFRGFLAGLGEFIYGLVWLITSAAAVVLGAAMLAISAKLRAKRNIGS